MALKSNLVGGRSRAVNLPAPVGGWNARDSLGDMAPLDAVTLTNLFPSPTSVIQRYGYTQSSTGFAGQCESLFYYYGGSSKKWFAVVQSAGTGKIYEITAGGAVGAALVTGLTNSRWQYVNSATTGGAYITCVNGADKRRLYDGTTWTVDGDASHDITNFDTATAICVNLHQNRLWFGIKNTLTAWYLPVESIAGAAAMFDISAFCPHGGSIVGIGTWTMDAGYGMNDMIVFITSNGDMVVYQGTNPASASTFSLLGVWWLGSPIGGRPFIKYQGDLAIICQDGIMPMSVAMQTDRLNPRIAISDKIQYAVSTAISNYSANFGWQLLPFPKENMLLLNVPVNEGSSQQQYVMSTIKRADGDYAWCNFTGWEANCWELINDHIYFGSNGFVGKAWSGLLDNTSNIQTDGLQAFNTFGDAGSLKRFTMMRPTLSTNGTPSIYTNMNIDFDTSAPIAPLSFSPTAYGVWDTGKWDTALWGSDLSVQNNWQGANGVGYWAAPHLLTSASGIQMQWVNTTIVFEPGAIL